MKDCCYWCSCELQGVVCDSLNAKRLIHVPLRLDKSVRGACCPLVLLSWPLYRRKLPSLCVHWCLCELQGVIVWMQKDSSMYLFGWINSQGTYGLLGLLSGSLNRRKLLSLLFMWTPRCNSLNAKRFIHVSVRLIKSVRGHMALWGYCLSPCTGESCCRWCFCVLQGVIAWVQ